MSHEQEQKFCPIDLVKSLPYSVWKVSQPKQNAVADKFFAAGKFYDYPWKFYCVWQADINRAKPLILVPYNAVSAFIRTIRKSFPRHRLPFPEESGIDGALIDFTLFQVPACMPKYLGTASTADQFQHLKQQASLSHEYATGALPPDEEQRLFDMIDNSLNCMAKSKSKAKEKSRQERDTAGFESLRKMQLDLGLAAVPAGSPPTEPIFICVDVEAYERNANIITEIGFATLDTRDLKNVPPGAFAEEWRKHIRGRHFRVAEHTHLRNSEFVAGCPEQFQFGESEFIEHKHITQAVASCFKPPYSAPTSDQSPSSDQYEDDASLKPPNIVTVFTSAGGHEVRNPDPILPLPDTDDQTEKRNLILLGHSTQADITFLRKLGYEVNNLSNLVGVQDTAKLWSAVSGNWQQLGLGKLCLELDIDCWFLHNAGNDAWYTMAAALAICVADAEGKKFGENAKQAGTTTTAAPTSAIIEKHQAGLTSNDQPSRSTTDRVKEAATPKAPPGQAEKAVQSSGKTRHSTEPEEDLMTFSDSEYGGVDLSRKPADDGEEWWPDRGDTPEPQKQVSADDW